MNQTSAARSRTWLVTGCSSGLGRALCERLLERGARVVCTARNASSLADLRAKYPERAIVLPLDVCDPAEIKTAVATALEQTGDIDVLVNNAGYGLVGALEEVDEQAIKAAFDANVYGAYRLIKALLPHMRQRGSGHILNVSSMAGFVASAGFCFYSATKFAVEGMSEALAAEVAPFGIKVTLIEPGPFRTDFRNRSMQEAPVMEEYAETVGKFRKMLHDTDGKQPGDPPQGGRRHDCRRRGRAASLAPSSRGGLSGCNAQQACPHERRTGSLGSRSPRHVVCAVHDLSRAEMARTPLCLRQSLWC